MGYTHLQGANAHYTKTCSHIICIAINRNKNGQILTRSTKIRYDGKKSGTAAVLAVLYDSNEQLCTAYCNSIRKTLLIKECEKRRRWYNSNNYLTYISFIRVDNKIIDKNTEIWLKSEDSSSSLTKHPQNFTQYSDVIMNAMVSRITGVSIVCWVICWGGDQRKHQSFAGVCPGGMSGYVCV